MYPHSSAETTVINDQGMSKRAIMMPRPAVSRSSTRAKMVPSDDFDHHCHDGVQRGEPQGVVPQAAVTTAVVVGSGEPLQAEAAAA